MRSVCCAAGWAAVLLCGCSAPPREQAAPPPAKVEIAHFYPSRTEVARGENCCSCYGTAGALSARIEPGVEGVSPSPNRCVEAAPTQDTTYRLAAAGPGGEATAEVSVRVTATRAGAAEASDNAGGGIIATFVATAPEVAAGERLTLCYIAPGADSLRLEPSEAPVTPGKGCVVVRRRELPPTA